MRFFLSGFVGALIGVVIISNMTLYRVSQNMEEVNGELAAIEKYLSPEKCQE